jgi:hypothetical protein
LESALGLAGRFAASAINLSAFGRHAAGVIFRLENGKETPEV